MPMVAGWKLTENEARRSQPMTRMFRELFDFLFVVRSTCSSRRNSYDPVLIPFIIQGFNPCPQGELLLLKRK